MPGVKDWLKKSSGDLKLATKSLGDDETLDPAVYLTHQDLIDALTMADKILNFVKNKVLIKKQK
jgi:hypothetical protein